MGNTDTGTNVATLAMVADSATPLFVIGTPSRTSDCANLRPSAQHRLPIHCLPPLSKPTENDNTPNRHTKPKVYGTARPNRKQDNKPVPQSVPLAFPASTNFTFKAPDSDVKFSFLATNEKTPLRSIQILPTDVLVLVIQSIEPNRHHQILKSLSLVNQALNAAIAPILYHKLRLFNLREVYDFSLHFRHPPAITSLEMFITPDPQDPGWLPPDTTWTERLVETLRKLERLMSLTIKRCDVSAALTSIASQASDPSFLPSLQKLTFGRWHELSSLGSGRSITSYGLMFTIQAPHDHEKLEQILVAIKQSSKVVQELKLTVSITPKSDVDTKGITDYRRDILHAVFKRMPELRTLILRTRCRNGLKVYSHRAADVLTFIPHRMENLKCLEIYDSRSPQFRSEATIKAATELSKEQGLCPRLESISLDGLLWKRVSASRSSPPLDLSSLTLKDNGETSKSTSDPSKKDESPMFFPKVTWTPCPSHARGRIWWARRVSDLHATSQTQAVFLLRQWMLQYWGVEHVPNHDGLLERAVVKW